ASQLRRWVTTVSLNSPFGSSHDQEMDQAMAGTSLTYISDCTSCCACVRDCFALIPLSTTRSMARSRLDEISLKCSSGGRKWPWPNEVLNTSQCGVCAVFNVALSPSQMPAWLK